jgi:hypothetical protein
VTHEQEIHSEDLPGTKKWRDDAITGIEFTASRAAGVDQ